VIQRGEGGVIHVDSDGISSLPSGDCGKFFVCRYIHTYVELGPWHIGDLAPLEKVSVSDDRNFFFFYLVNGR
jgi:hypothetical protein